MFPSSTNQPDTIVVLYASCGSARTFLSSLAHCFVEQQVKSSLCKTRQKLSGRSPA